MEVATRMRQAGDEPLAHRIGDAGEDDGERAREVLPQREARATHDEDIDGETEQFCGQFGEPFKASVRIALLDNEIVPFHIAQRAQAVP